MKLYRNALLLAVTGSGQPVPYDADTNNYSRVGLSLSGERCQYHWNATVYINTIVGSGDDAVLGQGDIGSLGSGWRPLTGLVLAGSEAFPAHSPEYILENGGPFYDQPDVDLFYILGEDGLGTATVTWHFTPVDTPARP